MLQCVTPFTIPMPGTIKAVIYTVSRNGAVSANLQTPNFWEPYGYFSTTWARANNKVETEPDAASLLKSHTGASQQHGKAVRIPEPCTPLIRNIYLCGEVQLLPVS